MKAKIITFQSDCGSQELSKVAILAREALDSGQLVVFPTETVYGLAVCTVLPDALDKIYQTKGRDASKPVAVLVNSFSDIQKIANIEHLGQKNIIEAFLPGPLTVILEKKQGLLPQFNSLTVGIRWSTHPFVQSLFACKTPADPYFLTSANLSGQETPCVLDGLVEQLGQSVDLILFDQCKKPLQSKASTVLSFDRNSGKPVILRHGAIDQEAIERAWSKIQ